MKNQNQKYKERKKYQNKKNQIQKIIKNNKKKKFRREKNKVINCPINFI